MCQNYAKHFFFLFSLGSLLTWGDFSRAQNSNRENAPYSRYGLGEMRNGLNTPLKGMGSISSGYFNPYYINTDNPASYTTLKLTTYEAGGEGSVRSVIANNQSFGTGTATLSHLTVGVPLGKNWGMAFGLRPFSRVFYRMRDTTTIEAMGPAFRAYDGDGSINYGFLGVGGKFKGLSAGFNFGYLFGTIRNSSLLQKQVDSVNARNSDFSKFTRVGGVYWKLGVLYDTRLKEKMNLHIGGTAALSQDVNARKDDFGISWRYSSGVAIADTAINEQNVRGNIKMPFSYSLGVHLVGEDRWLVGVDFSGSQWSQFRNFGMMDSVDNAFKIGVGGEYTPNSTSLYNYFQRVSYRLGFYYGRDYVTLNQTAINYYAATVGTSLPFKRSQDRIHLAFELGKRGTEANGLIRENFYKLSLGISLNDKWFVKRKYD
jgi:hypothetical protein